MEVIRGRQGSRDGRIGTVTESSAHLRSTIGASPLHATNDTTIYSLINRQHLSTEFCTKYHLTGTAR